VLGDIGQQLRELPSEAAPPYDFAEFRRRGRERSAATRQIITWPHAAAAAGLTAFVAAMAMLATSGGTRPSADGREPHGAATVASGSRASAGERENAGPPERVATTAAESARSSERVATPAAESARPSARVATVVGAESAAPESAVAGPSTLDPAEQARVAREWLARQPAEPALVRAGPRLAVASLEDRIAWFDDALTDQRLHGATADQLQVLQQERARLVSSLAQVRYAEALVADGS
jgi:hypothetical protein